MANVTINSSTIGSTQPNAPSGLTATTAFDGVQLDWTNPTNTPIDYIQIASSTTNNVAAGFTTVANVKTTAFYDHSTTAGNVYYWVRAVSTLGNIGPWNAANTAGTLGVPQEVTITSATRGQVIAYDGTEWVNTSNVSIGTTLNSNSSLTSTRISSSSTGGRIAFRVRKEYTGNRASADGPGIAWSYLGTDGGYDGLGMTMRYDTAGDHSFLIFNSTDASNGFASPLSIIGGNNAGVTNYGNLTVNKTLYVPGDTGTSAIISSGANQRGGAGYHGFLEVTNTAATNPNKFFRLNSTGGIEVVNSGYTAVILTLDNSGNLLIPGSIKSSSASAGIGYASGAGATVTQLTSKSTGVTINTPTGEITSNAAALNSATNVSFTVTNSSVAATDSVIVNLVSGTANNTSYWVWAGQIAAGSFQIGIRNITGGSLSEALVLRYSIIKGVSA